jgi:hypothetical protein
MDYSSRRKQVHVRPKKSLFSFLKKDDSPKLSLDEMKSIFSITSSLAFIYQITNPKNKDYLPEGFSKPNFIFSYEDAIKCSRDIGSSKWKLVENYIDIFEKDFKKYYQNVYKNFKLNLNIDKPFLIELLKKEALELQKGNVTLYHSKNIKYIVLDIISQLISGSSEGFKPKCSRKKGEKDKPTALEIIKKLFPNNKDEITDHDPKIRPRMISTTNTLFNNAFDVGESTLGFLYTNGSVLIPEQLINELKIKGEMRNLIIDLMKEIGSLAKHFHFMLMYCIPIEKLSKYVYPSKKYGLIDNVQDIYLNFKDYLGESPWRDLFEYNYQKQTRIVDLCFTKYSQKEGVRIYRLTDITLDDFEKFVNKIYKNLTKEIYDWFVNYVDIDVDNKNNNPLQSIVSYSNGILVNSE